MNRTYVLDANVFIEAKRRYYGFDLCPGFWDCLQHHGDSKLLLSIDRVKSELEGEDELSDWINNAAHEIFASTQTANVVQHYDEIINWVNSQNQFHTAAIEEFASIADGWLVAYAKANDCVVVTHEVHSPGAKKRIPIPNICRSFNIAYIDTFDMLRALEVQFHWKA